MNPQLLEKIEKSQIKKRPDIKAGDLVRVHQKIKEGKKERIQVFEGIVLRVKGSGLRRSFIVRKISFGVGVEKSFLVNAPNIEKIEVKKRAQVRRAYLTYLRNLTGKKARLKDEQFDSLIVNVQEEPEEEVSSSSEAKDLDSSAKPQNDTKDKKEKKDASSDASREAMLDKEVTELDIEEVGDIEAEVSLSEVVKKEDREAAEDAGDEAIPSEGGQDAEIAEIEEGVEEAEDDIQKGKNKDTDDSEKTREDITEEDIKEEIKEEA